MDNGPELTAAAMRDWCRFSDVQTAFIEPGSPWQNGYSESFNGRFRDEFLTTEQFNTLLEVQVLAEDPSDLGAFMMRLNKATCAKCPSNRFVTFFFSALDAATGDLRFANAGHNPPILMRASGEAQMLEGGGPVLGRPQDAHGRLAARAEEIVVGLGLV